MLTFMDTTSPAGKTAVKFVRLFRLAASGKDVRIRYGRKIYVLHALGRKIKNRTEEEYGLTRQELKIFTEKMDAKIEEDRKAGRSKKFTGDIEALL